MNLPNYLRRLSVRPAHRHLTTTGPSKAQVTPARQSTQCEVSVIEVPAGFDEFVEGRHDWHIRKPCHSRQSPPAPNAQHRPPCSAASLTSVRTFFSSVEVSIPAIIPYTRSHRQRSRCKICRRTSPVGFHQSNGKRKWLPRLPVAFRSVPVSWHELQVGRASSSTLRGVRQAWNAHGVSRLPGAPVCMIDLRFLSGNWQPRHPFMTGTRDVDGMSTSLHHSTCYSHRYYLCYQM